MQSVEELLGGTSKQLIVPIYQRHYSWGKEQCKQLWEDIIRLQGMPNGKHYLGTTLRSTTSESGENASYIIDGQQRITSIFLLLKALVDIAEREALLERPKRVEEEAQRNLQELLEDLEEKTPSEERVAKLLEKEREKARRMMGEHIECQVDPTNFRNTIIQTDLLDLHSQGDERFHIRPNGLDLKDLRAIFDEPDGLDSINRPIVVMYQFYLSKLEDEIEDKDRRWPNGFTVEEFYKLVNRLYVFDICLGNDDNAQAIFESINATGLALADSDKIRNFVLLNVPREEQGRRFKDYWNPTERVFAEKEKGAMDTFFRYYLMMQCEDDEVKETQVYAKFKDYWNGEVGEAKTADEILERIKRFADVYKRLRLPQNDKMRYTIEHVMPQTLNEKWRNALGSDAEDVHAKYLHVLGNLTLTAYNSNYSNRPFAEKLRIHKHGLAYSSIKLNKYFHDKYFHDPDIENAKWGKEEIVQRGEELADIAVKLWPWFGKAEMSEPSVNEVVECSLGEKKILTGCKILAFRFHDRQESVNAWRAMYQSVFTQLYAELGDDLKLARASISWITTEKPEGDDYLRLSGALYVVRVRTISVEEMLKRLRRLFNFLEISLDDLEFTVKRTSLDNEEAEEDDEEGEPLESDRAEAADNGELF